MFECTPYVTLMLNAGLGAGWPGDALAGDDERNMMRGLTVAAIESKLGSLSLRNNTPVLTGV